MCVYMCSLCELLIVRFVGVELFVVSFIPYIVTNFPQLFQPKRCITYYCKRLCARQPNTSSNMCLTNNTLFKHTSVFGTGRSVCVCVCEGGLVYIYIYIYIYVCFTESTWTLNFRDDKYSICMLARASNLLVLCCD